MPVIRKPSTEPETHPELVDEIARELEGNRAEGPPDAPTIVEEAVPRTDHLYVTVIWDKWRHVSPEARGRIIMDAYERARGRAETLRISLALGLTKDEADRVEIRP